MPPSLIVLGEKVLRTRKTAAEALKAAEQAYRANPTDSALRAIEMARMTASEATDLARSFDDYAGTNYGRIWLD